MKKVLIKTSILLFPLIILYNSGCNRNPEVYSPSGDRAKEKEGRIVLGLMPSLPPTKLFTKFQPLADYLTRITGEKVVLSTAPNFQEYIARLQKGEYELILPNPYQYIMVSNSPGYRPLVKITGIPFKGLIVVRKDSGINSITSLKGKKIAYPDPSALAATMQVRAYLKNQGITPENDTVEIYAASQESVILGVHDRLFDAAGTWPEALEAISEDIKKELKIVAETDTLPHRPIAIRADLPTDIADKVKNALLSMRSDPEGRRVLNSLGYNMFEDASDKDYDIVREWAKRNSFPFWAGEKYGK